MCVICGILIEKFWTLSDIFATESLKLERITNNYYPLKMEWVIYVSTAWNGADYAFNISTW